MAPSRWLLQIACHPDVSGKQSEEKEIDELHTANRTFERLRHYDWKVMDLLFSTLKKHLAEKRVVTDADVKRAVTKYLRIFHTGFCNAELKALVPQWDEWSVRGSMTCTNCHPCAIYTYTSKSE